jgi:hypothetical protein
MEHECNKVLLFVLPSSRVKVYLVHEKTKTLFCFRPVTPVRFKFHPGIAAVLHDTSGFGSLPLGKWERCCIPLFIFRSVIVGLIDSGVGRI